MQRRLVEWAVPHLCADKLGGTTGEQDRLSNPGLQCREIEPRNLRLKKPVGVAAVGEAPSLTEEFVGETHRVLGCTQTHTPGNRHQKGPICLWVVGELTESQPRAQQVALFPLGPLPHIQHHITVARGLPRPGKYLRLHPLYVTGAPRQKNMAQIKEQIKAPEKIQLSDG